VLKTLKPENFDRACLLCSEAKQGPLPQEIGSGVVEGEVGRDEGDTYSVNS